MALEEKRACRTRRLRRVWHDSFTDEAPATATDQGKFLPAKSLRAAREQLLRAAGTVSPRKPQLRLLRNRDLREMSVPDAEPATCLVRLIYRAGARYRAKSWSSSSGQTVCERFQTRATVTCRWHSKASQTATATLENPLPRKDYDDGRRLRQR